jgi:hypothetical protein
MWKRVRLSSQEVKDVSLAVEIEDPGCERRMNLSFQKSKAPLWFS